MSVLRSGLRDDFDGNPTGESYRAAGTGGSADNLDAADVSQASTAPPTGTSWPKASARSWGRR